MSSNSNEVAVSAAFMGIGYATACIEKKGDAVGASAESSRGQLETVACLADMADRLESMYCSLPEEIKDSALGVWAYEVAEPIGAWFGELVSNGRVPTTQEADAFMAELVAEFFTGPDGDEQLKTKPALLALLTERLAC